MADDFARKLIKGRIAETVFEQMFSEAGNFSIIPFGYERITPELANHKKFSSAQCVIDNIRTAPDFAVISEDEKKVFLVEVKFESNFDINKIIKIATEQLSRWKPSWLFVATLDKFYMGECDYIIKSQNIKELEVSLVRKDLQDKYLGLIREFEK